MCCSNTRSSVAFVLGVFFFLFVLFLSSNLFAFDLTAIHEFPERVDKLIFVFLPNRLTRDRREVEVPDVQEEYYPEENRRTPPTPIKAKYCFLEQFTCIGFLNVGV